MLLRKQDNLLKNNQQNYERERSIVFRKLILHYRCFTDANESFSQEVDEGQVYFFLHVLNATRFYKINCLMTRKLHHHRCFKGVTLACCLQNLLKWIDFFYFLIEFTLMDGLFKNFIPSFIIFWAYNKTPFSIENKSFNLQQKEGDYNLHKYSDYPEASDSESGFFFFSSQMVLSF